MSLIHIASSVGNYTLVPDIYNSLARVLNFSYSLSNPKDGKWGAVGQDGEWNGMIRAVMDDEADIVAASIAVTHARSTVVKFTQPFITDRGSFFVGRQSSAYSFDIFTKSFTNKTWFIIYLLIIFLSLSLFFIIKIGVDKKCTDFTFTKCFIYVYGAYCGLAARRWSVTPKNISSRILFLSVLLLGSVNHWHWKASIISNLSVVQEEIPFRSKEELLASSYQVTTVRDSNHHSFWENSNSAIDQQVWKTKFLEQEKSLKKSEKEIVSQAFSGEYAIYHSLNVIKNTPEYKSCKIVGTGYSPNKMDIAFALSHNSPYKDLINAAMFRMMENGELTRILIKHKSQEPICNTAGKGKPIGFENILLAFIILFGSITISVCFCLMEVTFSNMKQYFV